MKHFALCRVRQTPFATYGELRDETSALVAVTLERPWENNAHGVSCIIAGTYPAERYHSPKRGCDVFQLVDVPGRSNIELHKGNTAADSEGCILLGSHFGIVNGQDGITGSADAFERFMNLLDGENAFTLTITDVAPPTAMAA